MHLEFLNIGNKKCWAIRASKDKYIDQLQFAK